MPKRDEIAEEWRRLHNEELYLCSVLTIYHLGNQIKANELGQASGNLREGEHLEYLGVHGRIILKGIFKKWKKMNGMDCSGQEQVVVSYKCGNELIKCGEFLD